MRIRLTLVLVVLAAGCSCASAAVAAPSPRITFFFGLRRPEAQARSAFFAVEEPGSGSYRRFLSPRQVAARYGASAATRRTFVRAVRNLGLSASVDASGVFARVSGTVAQLDRAFHVRIRQQFGNFPNVITYYLPGSRTLVLPRSMRGLVREVVTTYAHSATPRGRLTGARATVATAGPPHSGTWVGGCAKARETGAFSYAQVSHAYGIDRIGSSRGASVAILNVGEGVTARDIAEDAQCFGYPRLRARTLLSDGQTEAFGLGTFEPQEDLDVVRGIAPELTSMIFTQVWLSPELWFLGASQVLDSSPLPDSLSISYGECEKEVRGPGATPSMRAGADLMDSLLARLGLAGVGTYAAAGDFGSTCDGRPFAGVAWPASSAMVTAVGGTRLTLNAANERSNEVTWNDLAWLPAAEGGGAGGGGYALASPRPPYQARLGLAGAGRAVPDVSAVASQFPAWPVVLSGNWVTDAGTSGATPLVAAAMATLSAQQRAAGLPPVGPANGLFYHLQEHVPGAFWDILSGANTYLTAVPGFNAGPGYDLASGLGVPQFAALPGALPAPAAPNGGGAAAALGPGRAPAAPRPSSAPG